MSGLKLIIVSCLIFILNKSFALEINVVSHHNGYSLMKPSEEIKIPKRKLLEIKKGNEVYRFRVFPQSEDVFKIIPVKDIKVQAICASKCQANSIDLNISESFKIYYANSESRLNKNQNFYKDFFGIGLLRSGIAGDVSIDGVAQKVVTDFSLSFEKFIYSSFSTWYLFGISTGLSISLINLDLTNHTYSYSDDLFNDVSLITLTVPVSFHFLPHRYFGIYGGINFNGSIIPQENEYVDENNGNNLNSTSSLSGGLSLGFHFGLNIPISNWIINAHFVSYESIFREDEEYQKMVNGVKVVQNRLTVEKPFKYQQIFIGLGINF